MKQKTKKQVESNDMKRTRYFIMLTLAAVFIAACKEPSVQEKKNQAMQYKPGIDRTSFGKIDGKSVMLYTIINKNGLTVKITNYGGIVTSLMVPDTGGNFADVVLGFDLLSEYMVSTSYFGALVGRYANRIAGGKFSLDGQEYILARNNGPNHLHGGTKGFDRVVWDAEEIRTRDGHGLKLTYTSTDGEEGYPGSLEVAVTYSLTDSDELMIDYTATTDKATPVNLSHHSYFNLAGAGNGDILSHHLFIDADKYTVVNDNLIPTGELRNVAGTPLDFRKPVRIGQRINQVKGGYDHNFILNNKGYFARVAEVFEPVSGRVMEVFTTEPGLQFYSGNFLDGTAKGKEGKVYNKHYGFCLETQHYPDSPNQPAFPNTILKPGEKYQQTTMYRFSVRKNKK